MKKNLWGSIVWGVITLFAVAFFIYGLWCQLTPWTTNKPCPDSDGVAVVFSGAILFIWLSVSLVVKIIFIISNKLKKEGNV